MFEALLLATLLLSCPGSSHWCLPAWLPGVVGQADALPPSGGAMRRSSGWLTAGPRVNCTALHAQQAARQAPQAPAAEPSGSKQQRVEAGGGCPAALLLVPRGYSNCSSPAPLLLLLHGAGGNPQGALGLDGLRQLAQSSGVLMLAPKSVGATWDMFGPTSVGPDAACMDALLQSVFVQYAVRADRIGLAGFSDGASEALTLGLANGRLFTHILAFSPGSVADLAPRGRPAVFISHGTQDGVLAIELTSRALVPMLRGEGYDVENVEFTGGHGVPDSVAQQGMVWFLKEP